jgi:flagellar biosynthesis protein FlhB
MIMGLSQKEEIHLYNLSLIPSLIVLYAFLIYFAFALHYNIFKTLLDTLLFMSYGFASMLATAFLSFEILYSRRLGVKFQLKRFVGRIIIMLAAITLLIVIVDFFASQLTWASETFTLSVSVVLWSSIWLILVAV